MVGYVLFETAEEAALAIANTDLRYIKAYQIHVELYKSIEDRAQEQTA
jgi:hypothetical protein